MTKTDVNNSVDHQPVCCTAGLTVISSFWLSLINHGGANIVMSATAYGGSSQLTDLLVERAPEKFKKHKFDIAGKNDLSQAIKKTMTELEAKKDQHMPVIVLFVEIPTNPDMKVPNIAELAKICVDTKKATGKELILFVDTTFAPASKCMGHIANVQGAD